MPTALSTGTSCSYVFVLIQCIISAEILKLPLLQRCSFQLPGYNNGAGVPLHWKNLIYNLPILNQERTEQPDELTASMFDFSAQPWKGSSGQRNLNLAKNFAVHQWRWFKYWGALQKNTVLLSWASNMGCGTALKKILLCTNTKHTGCVHTDIFCRKGCISTDANWTAWRNTVLQTV